MGRLTQKGPVNGARSWKHNYVEKMEHMQLIGDFFELPTRNDAEKYYSMLAEAYLVVVLYTGANWMRRGGRRVVWPAPHGTESKA